MGGMSDKVIELMEAVETLKEHCKAQRICDGCMFHSNSVVYVYGPFFSGPCCKLNEEPFRWNEKSLGTLIFPEDEDEDNSNSDHADLSPSYDHCCDYDREDLKRY